MNGPFILTLAKSQKWLSLWFQLHSLSAETLSWLETEHFVPSIESYKNFDI